MFNPFLNNVISFFSKCFVQCSLHVWILSVPVSFCSVLQYGNCGSIVTIPAISSPARKTAPCGTGTPLSPRHLHPPPPPHTSHHHTTLTSCFTRHTPHKTPPTRLARGYRAPWSRGRSTSQTSYPATNSPSTLLTWNRDTWYAVRTVKCYL